VAEWLKALPC